MPRMRVRVVCTLWVTIETLAPTIRFSSVDLPAFGSPISATNPQRVASRVMPRPPAAPAAPRPPPAAPRASRPPAPRRRARPSSRTSTEKTGAWSGPSRSRSTIGRRRQAARLRPFLQRGLGVAARPRAPRAIRVAPGPQDQRPRRLEAAVEIDRGDHRLHRVAEQRRLAPPAGQHLRAAHPQRRAEVERRPPPRRRSPCAPARSAAARARPRRRRVLRAAAPRR